MYATGLSQKYALLWDTSQFVCRSDSLKQSFSQEYLAAIDPDSIATFHYWYDNGRYEHEIVAFIWRQRDDILIKAIYGCDEIQQTDIITYPDLSIFFRYYSHDLKSQDQTLNSSWSHEFGYSFDVKIENTQRFGYIRDSRRGENNFDEEAESIKAANRSAADSIPIVRWLNTIDDVIRHDSATLLNLTNSATLSDQQSEVIDCDRFYRIMVDNSSGEITLPKASPKNLDESLNILNDVTSDALKDWIICLKDGEFGAIVHHNIGQYIRNRWGLWGNSPLSRFMNRLGIHHPDDMSSIILDSFQRRLKKEDIKLKEQVNFYQEYWRKQND